MIPNPTSRPDRPRYLIREAAAADLEHVRRWQPDALVGTPTARLLMAVDTEKVEVVGVAALRVFVDHVGRFLLYVEPNSRRKGCGTALLNAIREAAARAGVQSLLTVRSYEASAKDALTNSARAFLESQGLRVSQEIHRLRTDLATALAALEPLYQRFMKRAANPLAATIVPAGEVDPQALAAFAVRHVGGIPEEVAQRLKGYGRNAYSPTLSWVALVDQQIVGALLSVPDQLLVETRVVDEKYRGSGLNLLLMYRAAAAGAAAGYSTIELEHDTRETDTTKLVGRLKATQVGCRQCWGESLSGSAPAAATLSATREQSHIAAAPASRPPAPMLAGGSAFPASGPVGQIQPGLRAGHTPNFPELLRQLGASLLITTHQAGKLVMVRDEGEHLNLHFRAFPAPTGLALDGDRLAIATRYQVFEFANVPAVAAKLEPPGRHDACFLPRAGHCTGNISSHDMGWDAGGELWLVNTRFSCLCTLDRRASFTPRWRPAFISGLDPTDRCHLNGLGMVAGKPKYVTALGETDTREGWRAHKASGGVVIDMDTGAVLARGLAMPHSPRWHQDRLWVCASSMGTLGFIDLNTGKYQPVVEMPGITRGLDFAGPFAFVGLSLPRASADFNDAALAARLPAHEQTCGVCVVDLRSGRVVALLRFDAGVQEIFAVSVLGRRFPDLIYDNEPLLESSFVLPTEKR